MKNYVILGDSTCDLNKQLRNQYNIDYVAMNYVLDGKEYPASLDWESLSARDFYDAMRNGKRITTTQVPSETFINKFTECLNAGTDVLYIGCSSALSGSVNTANVVAKTLLEERGNADEKIVIIDALNSSFGQGLMLMKASELRAAGKTIEETAAEINNTKLCYNQCATVGKLDYLKRAGRVTASSAFFGNLIGIKPIIISDAKGQNYAFKKVKGAGAAKAEIAQYVADKIIDAKNQTVYISHADDADAAAELGKLITEKTGCAGIYTDYIGPIVGASVGPGTISAYFLGQEETMVGEV